jgi:hypothetical protein
MKKKFNEHKVTKGTMDMKKTIIIMLIQMALVIIPLQAVEAGKTAKLFSSDDTLDLTLEYNIKKFRKDKGKNRQYHPATLSYTGPDGNVVSLKVQIKARGKLRRTFLNCLIPPYKMKFNKKKTMGTLFEGQKSLKLVTHCKNKPKQFEAFYLQEFLVYRMYNTLTPMSFRVRLANISYIDTKKKAAGFTRTAFFIESYKAMAKRNNAKITKVKSIRLPQADFSTSTLVSVFQYLIGNTDWSIRSGHNVERIVFKSQPGKFFPVPFDFDLSGIIDASYARPDERIPIRSVRERYYRGFSKSLPQFNRTFELFRTHKEEIYNLYSSTPLLSEKLKKRTIKYLNGFYKIINNPKLVKRYFIDNYRGRPRPKR